MRQLAMGLCCGLLMTVCLENARANEALYAPVPAEPTPAAPATLSPMPAPLPQQEIIIGPGYPTMPMPVALYDNVRVRDSRRIHPCAVPMIVCVCDPCRPGCMVNVEICAPPCECVAVRQRWQGRKVEYDFGDYSVEITGFRSGQILVDYDS